jgi:methylenetetrahydrofolate dehydrogenase (NADP+) / methenyltetrahydrofolate cyclohydrolase
LTPVPAAMRGMIIDGVAISAQVREEVAAEVELWIDEGRRPPTLATILVGDDPASQVYVAAKHRACAEIGIRSAHHSLPVATSASELTERISQLNEDHAVDAILLQLPLPGRLDAAALVDLIVPEKDVDALSSLSVGRLWRERPALAPCTPSGIIEMLDRSDLDLRGCHVVIVGRSELVGRPLAALALARHATVSICHSKTKDLAEHCRRADVLVAACGRPRLIGAEHVTPGAVVIDVGISRTPEGLVGDVDFDAVRPLARAITPVPGGVGPMTIACLMRNALVAARRRRRTAGVEHAA